MFRSLKTVRSENSPNTAAFNFMENLQTRANTQGMTPNNFNDDELAGDNPPQYSPASQQEKQPPTIQPKINKESFNGDIDPGFSVSYGGNLQTPPGMFSRRNKNKCLEKKLNDAFLTATVVSILIFAIGLIFLQYFLLSFKRKYLRKQLTSYSSDDEEYDEEY